MIKLLDEQTISKIAAGEIIENSASIVKELVENSIDAGADDILIELRGESTNYIKVSDNGSGFSEDDLELAFLRHSTSKLQVIEDLEKIRTLGFRGEALASISNISKIKLMTKREEDLAGNSLIIENGKILKKNKVGMPKGTTFIINDVFYNTPVRKKFLRKDSTEINNIIDIVQKIALSNNNIKFTLIRDGKTILNTGSDKDPINRIFSILGSEIASSLNEGKFESENYKIRGFFSNNKLFRSNRDSQYIFVNGRFIRDINISRAIEKNYNSLIPLNRYPVFVLYIDIDPKLIDVNIHPKKNEIKISNENILTALLSEVVEEVIYPNRSIREIELEDKKENVNVFDIFDDEDDTEETSDLIEKEDSRNNHIKSLWEIEKAEDIKSQDNNSFNEEALLYREDVTKDNASDSKIEGEEKNFLFDDGASRIDEDILNTRISGVLFKTYILLENQRDGKVFVVDQHAAHERVNYEKFLKMYLNSEISSQILIKPEIIELNQIEYDKILTYFGLFNELGFKIEDFGDRSIVLREVPMIFGLPTYVDFIRDIIDSLDKDISSNYEADMYKIMRKACKASVKAGDDLSDIEIEALIRDLKNCENPYTCPHGRPTIVEVSKHTISKLFLRE
ncbi:DNA mismatch repair protein mutL [Peptoniphilus harei]|uniref:DNA mismatch repair protein MutL n=1 Tax=Peptoniphilus harei TaxID=54005 RepID=A0A943XVE2_9FIRM|nr:DNA mismatch repair endonuclease MutL [Peptoniphilus harei]MBS6534361.1 DNA mismatch repair endonuclease MutL [Peptoniphilus harei]MDU2373174.1 DNA mismatch repair endonuclease MutL [Peptoniphilus harei]MDU5418067.1 DNA mismatch repair endonuclease MutL [Peptoniphilus harei]QQE47303.1 DNA mismatch repair endonuclease MutL [Peptoniphilus harei]VEJ34136.1 DNA mismatch repair protein mutL [Peptoniphilus harei]